LNKLFLFYPITNPYSNYYISLSVDIKLGNNNKA